MKELTNSDLDERLQKQILQAREALKKGGIDYVVQVCGELLKKHPSAFEVRSLLWESLRPAVQDKHSTLALLGNRTRGLQFKISTRALLKKNPLELVQRCDDVLRKKQVFTQVFLSLEKAAKALDWLETRVFACQAVVDMEPEKSLPRLALAEALLEVKRPHQAIEHVEWVLTREPGNGEAQTLIKNASVAETLQRGNWEDKATTFRTKARGV